MKIKLIVILSLIPALSHADTILGLYAEARYWNFDVSGSVQTNSGPLNINNMNQSGTVLSAAIEHPIPFLPNIGLRTNNINFTQINSFNSQGQTLDISIETDLSHADIILYYELLDNWINLDLGMSVKKFDGYNYLYNENSIYQRNSINAWLPMAYAKGKFDLPFTGLSAAATLNTFSLKNNKATDFDLSLLYETDLGLGARLGYRNLNVDLFDSEDFNTNITTDGLYLGINFHF